MGSTHGAMHAPWAADGKYADVTRTNAANTADGVAKGISPVSTLSSGLR